MLVGCESLCPNMLPGKPVLSSSLPPAACTAHWWLLSACLGNPRAAGGLHECVPPPRTLQSTPHAPSREERLLDLPSLPAKQPNPTVSPILHPLLLTLCHRACIRQREETARPLFSLPLLPSGRGSCSMEMCPAALRLRGRKPISQVGALGGILFVHLGGC